MACHCSTLGTTSFFPSPPLVNSPKTRRTTLLKQSHHTISSQSKSSEAEVDEEEESKPRRNHLDILKLSVTLTVISASLPQLSIAAKVSEKKRSGKKKDEPLTAEEVKSWSQGLPTVTKRMPYTEILTLKREGKLKHVIKRSGTGFKQRPEVVLAVLEDSSVLRVVLPSIRTDKKFWASWDELGVDSLCVNAYTPPVKKPEISWSYLSFLPGITGRMTSYLQQKPQSKQGLEVKRLREDLRRRTKENLVRMREESQMVEKAMRAQKRMEENQRKKEGQKYMREELHKAWLELVQEINAMVLERRDAWCKTLMQESYSNVLGFVFLLLFYWIVVYRYQRQKKDFDDRLRIQKAEAEERKKMRKLEVEMFELADQADELEKEGKDEQNSYMRAATRFLKSGAQVKRSRRGIPKYLELGADVSFSDVAGLGKIRVELEEIVSFFTHGEMYRKRGVKIPGGILLCGPPGVGKTLLAKAVAGEANVNFFSISASQFVEIYVGVGASRVRSLYQEAKENAPSVVFIDELDAVGRERGLIKGSGGQERDATLNQLLVCLDGFEGKGEVITIASTNRPDILDPALVRPGRFDRKIYIPKPGLLGRVEILKVHARKKPVVEDVDYLAVATLTDGMVGAELANIVEIAAINMMRDGRTMITTDDLVQAAQIEDRGMLETKERSPEMWKQVAINEAAMAIVSVNFPDLRNIEFVNIAPRAGRELGYVRVKMDHIKFRGGMLSRQSLLDYITVQLAPRAADELWYGEGQLSTIWAETADNARVAARTFVLGGLSDKHYGMSYFWAADRVDGIDEEALRILNMCYERAKEILLKNQKLVDVVVDELVQKKSLNKMEFFHLVGLHGSINPMPPSMVDIRAAKRLQFQDMMMKQKEEAVQSNV